MLDTRIKMEIWVSPTAKQMAEGLILTLQIRQGHLLAAALGLPHYYENYTAIQQWTQKMLTTHHATGLTQEELNTKFLASLPSHMVSSMD